MPNRVSEFAEVVEEDVEYFKSILKKPGQVIEDELTLQRHNRDWTKKYIGQSSLCLKPNSTEELSKIMIYCNS
jgi:FAD/FMN-containing dehydrogenase